MKKAVIHINDLNIEEKGAGALRHVSVDLYEGEIVSFLGLDYSGKDLLARLLGGQVDLAGKTGAFYAGDERIKNREQISNISYRITPLNYMIRGWTVAEYVLMDKMRWVITASDRKVAELMLSEQMKDLGIDISAGSRLADLNEVEKRTVDLVKARIMGKSLVVLEDEFEGMNKATIQRFAVIMKRIINGKMAAVVCSHSDLASYQLAESFILFRGGTIVKKLSKANSSDYEHMKDVFFDTRTAQMRRELEKGLSENVGVSENDEVYSVLNFPLRSDHRTDLVFRRGEITTILAQNMSDRERIFNVLSGRVYDRRTLYFVKGNQLKLKNSSQFLKNKIVSAAKIGIEGEDGVLGDMSVSDNLLIPSLKKISTLEYIFNSKGLKNTILAESHVIREQIKADQASELEQNDRIRVALERWQIFSPDVLIFLEPFSGSDTYGVSLIRSYMKKFVRQGASVIIIKSRHEYIDDISDSIVKADDF